MSTSLRDQLLKAGLISQKQANEAERQQQHERRQERHGAPKRPPPPAPVRQSAPQAAKIARDQALNRKQQEKADRKARLAQIKQLIEQNRLPAAEDDPPYNFIDGGKIRKIAVAVSRRDELGRGEIVIVRHAGHYALVPAAIAARIRERDEQAVVAPAAAGQSAADDAYAGFAVPDDLIW